MGWSCRKDASDTLECIQARMTPDSMFTNQIIINGQELGFYEVNTRIEHRDGAITGKVFKINKGINADGSENAFYEAVGNFRIEGNGRVTRFPLVPKKLWPIVSENYL